MLLIIRTHNQAVLVRRPAFALYITPEEWDHYEPAEIASISNLMAHELLARTHVTHQPTQVSTATDTSITNVKKQDTTITDTRQLQQHGEPSAQGALRLGGSQAARAYRLSAQTRIAIISSSVAMSTCRTE